MNQEEYKQIIIQLVKQIDDEQILIKIYTTIKYLLGGVA